MLKLVHAHAFAFLLVGLFFFFLMLPCSWPRCFARSRVETVRLGSSDCGAVRLWTLRSVSVALLTRCSSMEAARRPRMLRWEVKPHNASFKTQTETYHPGCYRLQSSRSPISQAE
ncbi:hypothetical protein B0T19DRAFT_409000 [Cercophora scortea]|uniref:Uncharacterized protein n=1 Tax=Cercophora scortea TaxID=314031 RepID=A0AAE0J481_9PEZI|nr:hypothetical protein B0T19DRAFT_409000 [Cercophora scortea]